MNTFKRQSIRLAWLALFFLILGNGLAPIQAAQIEVSTGTELCNAVGSSAPGDIILLEDGIYDLSDSGAIVVRTQGLTIQGKRGNRSAVVVNAGK